MITKIFEFDIEKIMSNDPIEMLKAFEVYQDIGTRLNSGELIAFPTETVYGLGANVFLPSAVKAIYEAKGRPSDNPMIVHISDFTDIDEVAVDINECGMLLMEAFWPGPLTVVLNKSDSISRVVTGGLDTVAVRMPSHPIARSIIRCSGVPIAAPSANISGRPSPTKCEHVIEDLDGKIQGIVCADNSEIGIESTVVDCTGSVPVILRPGTITEDMILEVCGHVATNYGDEDIISGNSPKSPGMKYKHYAPKAKCILFNGLKDKVIDAMNNSIDGYKSSGVSVGVLTYDEYKIDFKETDHICSLGEKTDLKQASSNLYAALREFDKTDVEVILIQGLDSTESKGIYQALNNRINKASSEVIDCI